MLHHAAKRITSPHLNGYFQVFVKEDFTENEISNAVKHINKKTKSLQISFMNCLKMMKAKKKTILNYKQIVFNYCKNSINSYLCFVLKSSVLSSPT